jgi:hypothetical protein
MTDTPALTDALRKAAEWFQEYADGHAAKGDGTKAVRNQERANFCLEVLSAPPDARPEEELSQAVFMEIWGKDCASNLVAHKVADAVIPIVTAHARKAMAEELVKWCEERSDTTVGECQSDSSAAYQNVAAHVRRMVETAAGGEREEGNAK